MGVLPARRQRRLKPVDEEAGGRGRSEIRILLDPRDDVRVTAGLLEQHDPARGRVVVHPTPAPSRDHVFAHDLLVALGRPVNRLEGYTGSAGIFESCFGWWGRVQAASPVVLVRSSMHERGTDLPGFGAERRAHDLQ
jgi:hypothetical protein